MKTTHKCPKCSADLSLGEDGVLRRLVKLTGEFETHQTPPSQLGFVKLSESEKTHYTNAHDEYTEALRRAHESQERRINQRAVDDTFEEREIMPRVRAKLAALDYEPQHRPSLDERLDYVDRELSTKEDRHGAIIVIIVMSLAAAAVAFLGWVLDIL